MEHWFYLYIPWFFPLVMLALLGRFSAVAGGRRGRGIRTCSIESARRGR